MGLRRWMIVVLLVTVPLAGFGAVSSAVSGPYTLNCATDPKGFDVILTSAKTGQSSSFHFPYWGCP